MEKSLPFILASLPQSLLKVYLDIYRLAGEFTFDLPI